MDIKNVGVFTIKVHLADAFFDDDEVRKSYKGEYVELREPTAEEAGKFSNSEVDINMIKPFIIGSSFKDGDNPATVDQIAEAIQKSSSIFTHVVTKWGESLPLARKNAETLATQPGPSSGETE